MAEIFVFEWSSRETEFLRDADLEIFELKLTFIVKLRDK